MKLKKFKFPRRRRRKHTVLENETVCYKCLLLGLDNVAKLAFLDDLNMRGGKEGKSNNEGVLKLDKSEFVFWKVDPCCEKNKSCMKQYLDFHSPDMIFYFADVAGEEKVELMILQLSALVEVVQEDQNICVVVDKVCIDIIKDQDVVTEDLFRENILKMIRLNIDYEFDFCFSSHEEINQILETKMFTK